MGKRVRSDEGAMVGPPIINRPLVETKRGNPSTSVSDGVYADEDGLFYVQILIKGEPAKSRFPPVPSQCIAEAQRRHIKQLLSAPPAVARADVQKMHQTSLTESKSASEK